MYENKRMKLTSIFAIGAISLACHAATAATLPEVTIDDSLVFPESLSAAADGTLYVGSWKGIVYRAMPNQTTARPWIQPSAANGLLSILGVLVDDKGGQVWVCSVPAPTREPPAPGVSALMSFDLKTGAQRLMLPFPEPASVCNDITIAKDGTAYVSDTPNGRIFKVRRGSNSLELFAEDERLKGIDGIVFSGDGTLYANLVTKNTLWRIGIGKDGKAEGISQIAPSQALDGPDGFRLVRGNRFLLEENRSGRLDEIDITGDKATIKVLKDGLMTPTAAIAVKQTIYAVERKIDYLRKPELKGQDPGTFKVLALPLPNP
jgi:sugar lactone lactonase YvrE